MVFISTCSQDITTNIVMKELGTTDVLRFNIDKPEDFTWDFHRNGFRIADKLCGLFSVIREKKRLKPCSGIAQAHDFIGYNTHPST